MIHATCIEQTAVFFYDFYDLFLLHKSTIHKIDWFNVAQCQIRLDIRSNVKSKNNTF